MSAIIAALNADDVTICEFVEVFATVDAYLAHEDSVSVVGGQAFFGSSSVSSQLSEHASDADALSAVIDCSSTDGMSYHAARNSKMALNISTISNGLAS